MGRQNDQNVTFKDSTWHKSQQFLLTEPTLRLARLTLSYRQRGLSHTSPRGGLFGEGLEPGETEEDHGEPGAVVYY